MNFIDISIIIAALFGFYFGSLQGMDNRVTKWTLASLIFLTSLYFLTRYGDVSSGITSISLAGVAGLITITGLRYYKTAKEVREGLSVCMLNNNLGGVTLALFFGFFSLSLWDIVIVNEIVSIDFDNNSIFMAVLDNNDEPTHFPGVKWVASQRP